MTKFLRSRINSFKNAFSGLGYVIRTQKNAWIHLTATVFVIVLSFWLKLDQIEWAFIIFSIAFVWSAEILNTSIEKIFDVLVDEPHPLVKTGKDVGAAAVLISSIASVIISLLILLPKIVAQFN